MSSKVSNFLKNLNYKEKNEVQRVSDYCLQQVPSLQPQAANFVSNDGRQSTILKLTGTIPITYQGGSYNIPVDIWLPLNFPDQPPTCYVTPTNDMRVKARHKHVDAQGMVYLPYLHEWKRGRSDLVQLVASMISVFSVDPPVFKRSANTGVMYPRQPYPGMNNAVNPMNQRFQMPVPQRVPGQQQIPSGGSQYSRPAVGGSQMYGAQPGGGMGIQPGGGGMGSRPGGGGMGSQPGGGGMGGMIGASSSSKSQEEIDAEKTEKLKHQVTLKLQTEWQILNKSIAGEIDELFEAQFTLSQTSAKIACGVQDLQKEKDKISARLKELDGNNAAISKWLEENETRELIDVDEVLGAADTWSEQMFGLVAEDNAIDDAFYVLDSALENGVISLADFTRIVRKLGRDQFFVRALIKKIHEKQSASPNVPIAQPVSRQPVSHLQQQHGRVREGQSLTDFLQT